MDLWDVLGYNIETAAALTLARKMGETTGWCNRDVLVELFGSGDRDTWNDYFPNPQSLRVGQNPAN